MRNITQPVWCISIYPTVCIESCYRPRHGEIGTYLCGDFGFDRQTGAVVGGGSKIVAEQGGNVISVHHERNSESADVTGCALRIVMETRNEEYIASIR